MHVSAYNNESKARVWNEKIYVSAEDNEAKTKVSAHCNFPLY